MSPRRRRLSLYFRLYPDQNVRQAHVREFLRSLARRHRGHLILLWDGGSPHQGKRLKAFLREHPRLHIERFPAYAPELNPDEGVWHLAKTALANGRPDLLEELTRRVRATLREIARSPHHLRGCIRQTPLPLFLPGI